MMRLSFFLIIICFKLCSFADYRVFVLEIKNTTSNEIKTIKSTLDPEQFVTVFPIERDQIITYVETWRCTGNTNNFRSFCINPNSQTRTPEQSPDNLGSQKVQN